MQNINGLFEFLRSGTMSYSRPAHIGQATQISMVGYPNFAGLQDRDC
jgi:hypothetical protein